MEGGSIPDLAAEYLDLQEALRDLTGSPPQFKIFDYEGVLGLLRPGSRGIGYSQFNELLLLFGYNPVSASFFQFLVDGTTSFKPESTIKSLEALRRGVENFQEIALLSFGSVINAFAELRIDEEALEDELESVQDIDVADYTNRREPMRPIEPIPGEDTYFVGYWAEASSPDEEKKREQVLRMGRKNYEAYLASDYLDVYVATSMRQKHEYYIVNQLIGDIFGHPSLQPLKLRWFDPTQAYCANRIDKGLLESLMLKRAQCTLYFVQETDTLGKDSELASTLAQGKPVIAFVPSVDKEYTEQFVRSLAKLYPSSSERELILEQIRIFDPGQAWKEPQVRHWLDNPASFDLETGKDKLFSVMKAHYDTGANVLKEIHPLGLQVNLQTGVANGVLVVRTAQDCAELIRRIVLNALQFSVTTKVDETVIDNPRKYVYLTEQISGCIYRVVSGDPMLTNTFWNFYVVPS